MSTSTYHTYTNDNWNRVTGSHFAATIAAAEGVFRRCKNDWHWSANANAAANAANRHLLRNLKKRFAIDLAIYRPES